MKSLQQYLDDAKEITGSDPKTAEAIGVKKQYVSDARLGRGFSNRACRRLAVLLNVNPLGIIAAADAEKNPEEAAEWARWVAGFLCVVMVGAGSATTPRPAHANTEMVNAGYTLCARRLRAWLGRIFRNIPATPVAGFA